MKTPSEIFNVLGTKNPFRIYVKLFRVGSSIKPNPKVDKKLKSKTLCVNNPDFL